MTRKIRVKLDTEGYDILVGETLLDQAGDLLSEILTRPRTVIITDENVARHHLARLEASLTKSSIKFSTIILPAGEATKSFAALEKLQDQLLALKLERSDMIVAFGGGVIGDLVGFAASIFRRGIDFIQIPTTLLSQVDSSVGGKTGINTAAGKNLVGSFHQPRLVISDVSLLETLPRRQLLSGYAEVVKYGLIQDRAFFEWLEENGKALIEGDRQIRIEAIVTSCEAKARIVAEDEKETGIRALLNLGHTFGHALEAETGYSDILYHGEAVAIGTMMAFDLSAHMGLCSTADAAIVKSHFIHMGLPHRVTEIDHPVSQIHMTSENLIHHMAQDKKMSKGRITFILATAIGEGILNNAVSQEEIRWVYDQLLPPDAQCESS